MKKLGTEMEQLLARMQEKGNMLDSKTIDREYKCDKCKDDGGWTEQRDSEVSYKGQPIKHEVWVKCGCALQREVERLIKSSSITEEFQKMGFKNYEVEGRPSLVKEMRDVAVNYYKAFPSIRKTRENSVSFVGQVGAGKTHLLSAIANGLMNEHRIPVMYFPYVEMMDEISKDNYEHKNSIISKAQEVEVLFIDDLFKPVSQKVRDVLVTSPRATPFEQTVMQAIVNHRYLNNKPILLSSELSYMELLNVNEALGSRLFEMCSEYTVQINADPSLNWRMRKMFK